MSSHFDQLKRPGKDEVEYEEWGGQFSCQQHRCVGIAKVAKFFPKQHLLAWECEDGHRSYIEDVYE